MKSTLLAPVSVTLDRITPLYDYLLVRRLHDEPGLIALPERQVADSGKWVKKDDHGPRRGEVVAAGRGDKIRYDRAPMDVNVGDVIIYPRFEANHVNIGGEEYTFVHEGDVMAVLDS